MKRNVLSATLLSVAMVAAMSSCSKDEEPKLYLGDKNPLMTISINNYVDDVVIPTYSNLATKAMALNDACNALAATEGLTDENIEAAADAWVAARKYWENSEAFLFGPAGDYAIDPHIDSWPLDQKALDNLLTNEKTMEGFYDGSTPGGDDAIAFAGETLGSTLLGFHSVEYMLFLDGEPRTVAEFNGVSTSSHELAYLLGVVGDLRNQCILLECSWAGIDNITAEKAEIMEDTELARALVYGDVMKSAGDAGNSLYKSQKSAMSEILNGIITIVDEVGNTKIQDPIDSGNPFDVESWFSYNSIIDFTDNVKGCQMAYAKISDYIKSLDAKVDSDIKAKFDKAILEVGGESGEGDGSGMAAPFRDHVGSKTATVDQQQAIDACNALMEAVEAADELVNAE